MFDSEDSEKLVVSTAVVKLTEEKIRPTTPPRLARNKAVMTLEKARIRVWLHGKDPTGNTGLLFSPNSVITITGVNDLLGFRAIRASGEAEDAILNIQYMRG